MNTAPTQQTRIIFFLDHPPGDASTLHPESLSGEDFTGNSFPFAARDRGKIQSNLAQAWLLGTSGRPQAVNGKDFPEKSSSERLSG